MNKRPFSKPWLGLRLHLLMYHGMQKTLCSRKMYIYIGLTRFPLRLLNAEPNLEIKPKPRFEKGPWCKQRPDEPYWLQTDLTFSDRAKAKVVLWVKAVILKTNWGVPLENSEHPERAYSTVIPAVTTDVKKQHQPSCRQRALFMSVACPPWTSLIVNKLVKWILNICPLPWSKGGGFLACVENHTLCSKLIYWRQCESILNQVDVVWNQPEVELCSLRHGSKLVAPIKNSKLSKHISIKKSKISNLLEAVPPATLL